MKNITNESIFQDFKVISAMFDKYEEAVYEKQHGQKAHYDNQSKAVRLYVAEIRAGLEHLRDSLSRLHLKNVIEDGNNQDMKTIKERIEEFKQQNPDTLLIFYCGSYYVAYDDDARTIARVLGLELKEALLEGVSEKVSFPFYKMESYQFTLTRAGERVAIYKMDSV